MTTVKTNLTVGKEKKYFFTEATTHNYIMMYDNPSFEKAYNNVEDFLAEFEPTKPSENLINRINEEFLKKAGKITYKPKGFKANQIFYFSNI